MRKACTGRKSARLKNCFETRAAGTSTQWGTPKWAEDTRRRPAVPRSKGSVHNVLHEATEVHAGDCGECGGERWEGRSRADAAGGRGPARRARKPLSQQCRGPRPEATTPSHCAEAGRAGSGGRRAGRTRAGGAGGRGGARRVPRHGLTRSESLIPSPCPFPHSINPLARRASPACSNSLAWLAEQSTD
jgi:hypothetical protein